MFSKVLPSVPPTVFLAKEFGASCLFRISSFAAFLMKSESHFQAKVLGHKDIEDSFVMEESTRFQLPMGLHLLMVCDRQ